MEKEKMLQFLSKAIDNGAKISVLYHGFGVSRNDAKKKADEFSEIVDGEVTVAKGELGSKWFAVRNKQFQLDHFYRESGLQEDVDLSGMTDDVHESA